MSVVEQVLHAPPRAAKAQRAPVQYTRAWAFALVSIDLVMFVLSSYLGLAIVSHTWRPQFETPGTLYSMIASIVIWLFCFERVGLYKRSFALSSKDEFYYTVAALIVGVLPQLTLFTLVPSIPVSRLVLLLSVAFAIVTVGGARALASAVKSVQAHRRPRRIAIVGHNDRIGLV